MSSTPTPALLSLAVLTGTSFARAPLQVRRPGDQLGRFARLYRQEAEIGALIERLEAARDAAGELDAAEGRDLLAARIAAELAAWPAMPPGVAALLDSAAAAADEITNPFRARAVLIDTASALVAAPDAFVGPAGEVFPRVLRRVIRRAHLPGLDHAERLAVLGHSGQAVAARAGASPSPHHAAALAGLATLGVAPAAEIAPAALVLALVRGFDALAPEFPEAGASAFRRAARAASGANTPAALARALCLRLAAVVAAGDLPFSDAWKAGLAAAVEASGDLDDASAADLLRAAFAEPDA